MPADGGMAILSAHLDFDLSRLSPDALMVDRTEPELQRLKTRNRQSDGTPMTVRRIRQSPLKPERSAQQIEKLECRRKADVAKVLPRDWTAFVIRCLAEEDRQKP